MITNACKGRVRTILEGSSMFSGLYLAVSADTTAPAVTDNTLTGEITTNGLGRQAATVTHTSGTGNDWNLTAIFTYTGSTAVTVNKIGVFDASTGGNLLFEAIVTAVTVNVSGDYFTISEDVTIA